MEFNNFELEMIENVKTQLLHIKKLQKDGMSLQKLTSETYNLRESGQDFMYFSWLNKSQGSSSCLAPSPISTQSTYKSFFNIVAPGSKVLKKFTCYVYEQKIEFFVKEKIDDRIVTTNLFKI